jgi:hypothetical protein
MKICIVLVVCIGIAYSFKGNKNSCVNRQARGKLSMMNKNSPKPEHITISALTAVSGPLGVLLDNQHGLFGVLNYHSLNMNLFIGDILIVKSAYWVPVLFAFAGFAMSSLQLIFDGIFEGRKGELDGPTVLYGISAFSAQYYLSGLLDNAAVDPLIINLVLSLLAITGFLFFDGSVSGLALALATAVAGPLAETTLINLGLYNYSHPDVLNFASWIPAVYFLGGPAVGNLTRYIYKSVRSEVEEAR